MHFGYQGIKQSILVLLDIQLKKKKVDSALKLFLEVKLDF